MDANLDSERNNPDGSKKTYGSAINELPSGAMFLGPKDGQAYLVFNDKNFRWTPAGYEKAMSFAPHTKVQVLTPRPIVDMLVAGFPLLNDDEDNSYHLSLWDQG